MSTKKKQTNFLKLRQKVKAKLIDKLPNYVGQDLYGLSNRVLNDHYSSPLFANEKEAREAITNYGALEAIKEVESYLDQQWEMPLDLENMTYTSLADHLWESQLVFFAESIREIFDYETITESIIGEITAWLTVYEDGEIPNKMTQGDYYLQLVENIDTLEDFMDLLIEYGERTTPVCPNEREAQLEYIRDQQNTFIERARVADGNAPIRV